MNRKELKKKITDLLKEFETVKVSNTKTGILVETFKNDDFIQATWQQVFCLKKLCNHKSLLNLIKIDKRWLIPTVIDNKINPDLKIYAKSKSKGKYQEFTEELYRAFIEKLISKQHIMGRFDFPHTDKNEKDLRLYRIFNA